MQEHGRLTLAEMNRMWINEAVTQGNPLPRSTFNRHRDAILDMFGLIIDCDNQNRYFISNPNFVDDNSIERWMLSTLMVNVVLIDSLSLKDRIMLEDVPAGVEYLQIIIRAIKDKRKIKMVYQRFGSEAYEKVVSPVALKLSNRRWYLLVFTGKHMATYSLDRMLSVSQTDEPSEMTDDFDAQQYFAEYYGVLTDGTPLEHIVLRAYGKTANYLRTLPLHSSQQELTSGDDYTDFALDIRPTKDFIGELLSHDEGLEVLEPESVRQKMKELLIAMTTRYQQEN